MKTERYLSTPRLNVHNQRPHAQPEEREGQEAVDEGENLEGEQLLVEIEAIDAIVSGEPVGQPKNPSAIA